MKYHLIWIVVFVSFFSSGFVNTVRHEVNKLGCAGSNCHTYRPGIATVKPMGNMKLRVQPKKTVSKTMVGAQLIDHEGILIDWQDASAEKGITLSAQKPGRYKLNIGYVGDKPYYDTLWVELKPSLINIPGGRSGGADVTLFPSHPSPAKESAVLRFSLPHQADVEVTLYTVSGKKVRTIYRQKLAAGLHELLWETRDDNGRLLPTGKYLCELRSDRKKVVETVRISN